MQPRLKSSKKWTAFPKDYLQQIQKLFKENFTQAPKGASFVIEGYIYPEEVTLRIGLAYEGQLKQDNFEVSIDYKPTEKNVIDKMNLCVDAVASLMTGYFENPEEELPRIWTSFPFNKDTVYIQYTTDNSALDTEANKLLGLDQSTLLQGETDDLTETEASDKDEHSHDHESEDDETDDDGRPRMFRKLH